VIALIWPVRIAWQTPYSLRMVGGRMVRAA